MARLSFFLVLCLSIACGDDDAVPDAATSDTGGGDRDSAADTGSDAANDAGSDVGNDSGSDAGPMERTFPAAPSLDGADFAKVAALVSSCLPDDGAESFLNGYYFNVDIQNNFYSDAQLRCIADATDGCAALQRCAGLTFDFGGPCDTDCDGEVLSQCDDEVRFVVDCAQIGLSCDAEANTCLDTTRPTCPAQAGAVCMDGIPTGCDDGYVREGYECGEFGLTCMGNFCIGEGMCDVSGTASYGLSYEGIMCTSDAELSACVHGGRHTIRCADVHPDFGCQVNGGRAFCGLAGECNPEERGDATCDGTNLVICNAGRNETIDCTALGFTGCTMGGRDGAYCSPSPWQDAG